MMSRAFVRFSCALLACAAPLALTAGTGPAQGRPITLEDALALKSVSSAVLSPDGETIAYVRTVPRKAFADDDGPPWAELWVSDQTGASRPYVTGEVNVAAVAWTPDGQSISFLAKRAGDEERCLYAIPLAGGESRRLLAHATAIAEYSWSPDGKSVAFVATEEEPKRIKELADKGFKAEVYEESPHLAKLWVARPFDEPAGEPRAFAELPGHASDVQFAPDGKRIALALAPSPGADDQQMARRVHVVDAESGAILARIENPGKLGEVRWSPDGKLLALISGVDPNDPSTARLLVVPASGGAPRELAPGAEWDAIAFGWEDAETLLFLADHGLTTALHEIAADGSGFKTILAPGSHALSGLTLSRDGQRAAMVGSSARFPAEAFAMSHGDDAPRRLTDSNAVLAEIRLAEQQTIAYTARDGLALEGVLIRPLDEVSGTRVPLILVVHGGPESHFRDAWLTGYSSPGQVAAARGYAVFYPNYRGSTGRGVAFAKSSQADPAGKEFDDLVDGVDHLVALGLVDAAKVGVTGGSYGGYATAWCSTKLSERFAAGVMMVGITDLVSKSGTTDIPGEMHDVHWRKHATEDWDLFLERSPVRWVEEARTPLLIVHGKDDTRVHPAQSLELYRQLKLHGQAPVRLVQYPGEGHGNRKDPARYDYALRMLQWFDHYLVGPGGEPPPPDLEYPLEKKAEPAPSEPTPASATG